MTLAASSPEARARAPLAAHGTTAIPVPVAEDIVADVPAVRQIVRHRRRKP